MTWVRALMLVGLVVGCAPRSTIDRGDPTDGRGDFMRAGGRSGDRNVERAGQGGSGGARTTPIEGGGGQIGSVGQGGTTGAGQGGAGVGQGGGQVPPGSGGSSGDVASPEDVRDAKPLPALRDANAANCKDLPGWQPNKVYNPGASVVNAFPSRRFKCRPFPNSGWCSSPEYEPAGPKRYWPDAWIDEGLCPEQ